MTSHSYLSFTPTITPDFVSQLQELVNQFINHVSNNNLNQIKFIQCIDHILAMCFNITPESNFFTDNKKDLLIQGLVDVHNISVCGTELWTSDGNVQSVIQSSLGSLLLRTLDNNYHTYQGKCHSVNKNGQCSFGNKFVPQTLDHIYKCSPFHEYDSVSMHLVLACLYNALWGLDKNMSVLHCALLGLYHDIGKPLTVETIEFKNTTMTGFPAHAEIGCMIFQMHWNPGMIQWIQYSDYFAISKTILRHMCGYHEDRGNKSLYKRELLLLDPMAVRSLLSVNRVGDHFGKLVPPDHIVPFDHFLDEQRHFESDMNKQFNFQQILSQRISATEQRINNSKYMVYLIGRSGAGKTYFANSLIASLPPGFVNIVSRDHCIANVVVGVDQRLCGMDYILMYKIYEAGKNLHSITKKQHQLSKKELSEAHKLEDILIESQVQWNNHIKSLNNGFPKIPIWEKNTPYPNFTNQVQIMFNQLIQHALNDKSVFVVLDTMMNCFPYAVESSYPDITKMFIIHVHVQSFLEVKDSSVAETINHQLRISGPYGPDMPLHPNGFKNNKDRKLFASLSSDRKINGFLPDKCFKSKFRPHLVFVCTRTNHGNFGYDETITSLKNLCDNKFDESEQNQPIKKAKTLADIHIESRLRLKTEVKTALDNVVHIHTDNSSSNDQESDYKFEPATINNEETMNESEIINESEVSTDDFFGVNPETKFMNVRQFYQWVFDKFAGDRSLIQEYMRTQNSQQKGQFSFMHTSVLNKSFAVMKGDEKKICCDKLSQLSVKWKANGIVIDSHSAEEFSSDEKLYEIWVNSLPCLKYYEQWGARFWTKYAIEMRGTCLFVNPCNLATNANRIKILAMKLPRGAEAVTGMVLKNGIETQDVKPNKIKILDLEQQDTCTRLCRGDPISMYLTSKGDGSLLTVTAYTGNALNIILPVIELFGSDYVKLWAEQSLKLSQGKRLLVPATQGTLMESGFMGPYMVTAILSGSGIVDRETMINFLNSDSNPNLPDFCTVWKMYGEKWIRDFLDVTFFDSLTDTHTFNFEAICENRKGLFGDQYHNELACLYSRDRLIFLGVTICEKRFYVPHCVYSQKCKFPWEEPLFWTITHADQVNQMIDDLELMVFAKLSKIDYLTKFPPSNHGFNILDPKHIENAVIDFEGWVGMKIASLKINDPDHIEVMKFTNFPVTVYSKIKIRPYYEGHKFHIESIPYLTELAKTAGHIFPLSRKIAGIFKDGVIAEKLERVGVEIMKFFDFKSPNNILLKSLEESYNQQLADAEKRIQSGEKIKLPKSPLIGFFERPCDVQCRIALKANGSKFGKLTVPIFLQIFPEIDPDTNDFEGTVTKLIMHFKPWLPGYSDRIKNLEPTSPCIQDLIVACIGTSFDIVRKPTKPFD